jgi:DNA repair exonuclease SbcCD ATPase subunit
VNPVDSDAADPLAGGSSADSLSALALAVSLLDGQVGAIAYPSATGPGLDQMAVALGRMQDAASRWPATEAALIAAAQQAVALGDMVDQLDSGAAGVDALVAAQSEFVRGPLHSLVDSFSAAEALLNEFNDQMTDAYAQGATANTDAENYLRGEEIKFQNAMDDVRAEIDSLQSASGIAATVFTAGIYGLVKLEDLQDKLAALEEQQQQLRELEQRYAEALGAYSQALETTRQSAYAIETLNTTLQQLAAAASDVIQLNSPNLTVMQAVVQTLKTECHSLAGSARELASMGH